MLLKKIRIVRFAKAAFLTACTLACFASCAVGEDNSGVTPLDNNAADKSLSLGRNYMSLWDGREITADIAEENEMVFVNASESSDMRWADFLELVKNKKSAEITLCQSESIVNLLCVPDRDGDSANIMLSETNFSDGKLFLSSVTLSSDCIYEIAEGESITYYAGEYAVYETKNSGESSTAIPFEQKVYECSSDANVTFPYQKMFSSYSDFKEYYKKYNGELEIQALKSDMEAFEDEGGFNTHIVFLRAEMSGFQSIEYETVKAVKTGNALTIYVAKRIPQERQGSAAKRQIVVTVPSEYLDEISPKNISWVIYDEK